MPQMQNTASHSHPGPELVLGMFFVLARRELHVLTNIAIARHNIIPHSLHRWARAGHRLARPSHFTGPHMGFRV